MKAIFPRIIQGPDIMVGAAVALVIGSLGWLAVANVARQDADASIRTFGTLLTVFLALFQPSGGINPHSFPIGR
jgi:hypothetical protein